MTANDNRRRVLLVDDSRFVCDVLAAALHDAGFEVAIARDLSELERAVDPPDLILIDVVLQEAFGDEVAFLLRCRGATCPIILLSSLPDAELARRVAEARLDGFVSKRAGIGAVVDRVCRALGGAAPKTAARHAEIAESFAVDARQRSRSVVYISARPDRWNAAAIVGELHALAGDADLARAAAVADAARACRDAVRQHGTRGWTPGIAAALSELAKAVGAVANVRKLLVIDHTDFCHHTLLRELDAAGHVVVEAKTLAVARQRLRAADYDVIVLHAVGDPAAVLGELHENARTAKIVVLADHAEAVALADVVLSTHDDAATLVARISELASSS